MTEPYRVCPVEEIPPGERKIVEVNNLSIGVFNVDGEFYALKNDCPHQRAPLCKGTLTGTTTAPAVGEADWDRDGEILRCPWHGWEFDVTNGESVFNPHKVKAKTFDTTVETGTSIGENPESDCSCGVTLQEDEPTVDTYDVEVESDVVVVYI